MKKILSTGFLRCTEGGGPWGKSPATERGSTLAVRRAKPPERVECARDFQRPGTVVFALGGTARAVFSAESGGDGRPQAGMFPPGSDIPPARSDGTRSGVSGSIFREEVRSKEEGFFRRGPPI